MLRSIFGGVLIGLGAYASYGLPKPINGIVFSIGLFLIILLNMNLFTGSILKVKEGFSFKLIKEWTKIFIFNFIGCFLLALMLHLSDVTNTGINEVAVSKAQYSFLSIFLRGILCNMLVCITVLVGQRSRMDFRSCLGIMAPVTLFVVSGYEHSVANMFYYSLAILNGSDLTSLLSIVFVSMLGNIIGGLIIAYSVK